MAFTIDTTHRRSSGVLLLLATAVLAVSGKPAEGRDFFSRYNSAGYSWMSSSAWIEKPDTNGLPGSNDVIKIGGNHDNRYAYDLIRLRGGARPTVLRGYIGFDGSNPPWSFGYLKVEEGSMLTVRETLYIGGRERGEVAVTGSGSSLRAAGLKLGSYSGGGEGEVRLYPNSEIRTGHIWGGGGPKDFQWRGGTLRNIVGGNMTIDANLGAIRLMNSTWDHIFYADSGRTITVNSPLTGTGYVTKKGPGTLTFGAANTYTTPTEVSAGTLRLGTNNRIANGSDLYVTGGTFDLGSYSDTVDNVALHSGAIIGSGTLTGSRFDVWAGTISARLVGNGDLLKGGTGTVTLSGSNAYRATDIQKGVIRLAANECIPHGGNSFLVVEEPATLNLNNYNETVLFPFSTSRPNTGTILLGNGTLTVTGSGVRKFSGEIEGNGSLVKTGTGTQTFDGTLSPGTIHVNQGTLRAGKNNLVDNASNLTVNGGTFDLSTYSDTVGAVTLINGSIRGSGTITGSAYDVRQGTIHAKLGGSGVDLVKSTDGIVTLNNSNSYTGSTVVRGGRLKIGRDDAVHDASSLTVENGAVFDLNSHNERLETVWLSDGTINGSSGGGAIGTLTANFFILKSGAVTAHLAGGRWYTDLEKHSNGQPDGGIVTLYKSNSYGGDTEIRAGTLRLAASNVIPDGSAMRMDSIGTDPNSTFDLNNHSETIGELEGGGIVSLGSGTLTLGSNLPGTFIGAINGAGSLVKKGRGVQFLDGANTYTGPTVVGEGMLDVRGSLAAESQVSVADGAWLAGTGTVAGPVTVQDGGSVSPGTLEDRTGTLTTGSMTFQRGSTLFAELSGPASGSDYDQLVVSGQLDLSAADDTLLLDWRSAADPSSKFGGDYVIATYGTRTGEFDSVGGGDAPYNISEAYIAGVDYVTDDQVSVSLHSLLDGDADLDGDVDFGDYLVLEAAFGGPGRWINGDFDFNGVVDFGDYLILEAAFGDTVLAESAAVNIPEPGSLAMLFAATLGLLLHGRRRKKAA